MKKIILTGLLLLSLVGVLALPAGAESYTGSEGWTVAFTADQRMQSTFRTRELDDAVAGLQPGDDITFTLRLSNRSESVTDWYMTSKVLYSLEDRSANAAIGGGAYTYVLTYTDAAGIRDVLFDSDTVGGEHTNRESRGLHEATEAMEDYFFLDTLQAGRSGRITLKVALDGETQGNDYQDTLADLQMNFAVELEVPGTPSIPRIVVRTGDERNPLPYYIVMAVSGVLFLVLAVDSLRRRKKAKREGKR